MKTQKKTLILKIFVLMIVYLCLTYSYNLQAQTIPLESGYESAIAWSPDSSEIAIGTQEGLFIINALNGEISKSFVQEKLTGGGFHTQRRLEPRWIETCFTHKDEVTIHYPTDIWIIDLKEGTAKQITHSTPIFTEDCKGAKVQSFHYRTPIWTADGCCILLTVETIDKTFYKDDTQSPEVITLNVNSLDPETGKMEILSTGCCPEWSTDSKKLLIQDTYGSSPSYSIDYDEGSHKLLLDTKTSITQDEQRSLFNTANSKKIPGLSLDDQHVSPDGKKVIIKMSKEDGRYQYTIKDAY